MSFNTVSRKKLAAAVGIWTIDQEYSMISYLDICVDLILTNRPKRAAQLIDSDNISLPGSALKEKLWDRVLISPVSFWKYDCSYFCRLIGERGGILDVRIITDYEVKTAIPYISL